MKKWNCNLRSECIYSLIITPYQSIGRKIILYTGTFNQTSSCSTSVRLKLLSVKPQYLKLKILLGYNLKWC